MMMKLALSNRKTLAAVALLVIAVLVIVLTSNKRDRGQGASADSTRHTAGPDRAMETKSIERARNTRRAGTPGSSNFGSTEAMAALKLESLQQLNRLGSLPGLTGAQQEALRTHFQRREEAAARSLQEATKRGLLDDEETAIRNADQLQAIVNRNYTEPRLDAFLKATLTPEQHAEYSRTERLIHEQSAVVVAREQLAMVAKHVDLDAAERDQLNNAVCDKELASSPAEIDLAELMNGPHGLQLHKVVDVLAPDKLQTLMTAMAEEKARGEELLREMFPGAVDGE